MMGSCKLNNKNMRNLRKDTVYQCVVVDLYLIGVIEKEEAEELLGCGIPRGLCLPSGIRPVDEVIDEAVDEIEGEETPATAAGQAEDVDEEPLEDEE